MVHLDTNFLIQALVVGSVAEGRLRAWIVAGEDVAISSIALSEFLCGPVTPDESALVETLLGPPEPFLARMLPQLRNYLTPLAVARGVWRIAKSRRWRFAVVPAWQRSTSRTSHYFKITG